MEIEREGERWKRYPTKLVVVYLRRHLQDAVIAPVLFRKTHKWTVTPFLRDSFSMIGTAVGGTASAFYGFNKAMPVVQRFVRGPMWVHFLVGSPPVIVFSSACAGLAGGALPALAQLIASSCHAAISSSSLRRASSRDDEMHKSKSSSPL